MNASMHWSKTISESVVGRKHAVEIEELLECILTLRVCGILARVHRRWIIGTGSVVVRPGVSRGGELLATSWKTKLDWRNSAQVELVARKHSAVAFPCAGTFPRRILRIPKLNVIKRASRQGSSFCLRALQVTRCDGEIEVRWCAVYGGIRTRTRRRRPGPRTNRRPWRDHLMLGMKHGHVTRNRQRMRRRRVLEHPVVEAIGLTISISQRSVSETGEERTSTPWNISGWEYCCWGIAVFEGTKSNWVHKLDP